MTPWEQRDDRRDRDPGLGKRYGRNWALEACTLSVPAGRIVGLVGPNGAGKSTLLGLATALITPTTGSVEVLGERPGASADLLARVGFVAQDTPVYADLSVADHLKLGAKLNRRWDAPMAEARIRALQLDPKQKAGKLSGGQRAQLALTLVAAKRPELLLLDEPVAALDRWPGAPSCRASWSWWPSSTRPSCSPPTCWPTSSGSPTT